MKAQPVSFLVLVSSAVLSQAALVGYWNMDEASGNLSDSSGNGFNGIKRTAGPGAVYGEATVAPGTYGAISVTSSVVNGFGTSIDFAENTTNNRSNYDIGTPATVTNLITSAGGGTGTMTIMAWINLDTTSGTQRIFGTGVGGSNGWAFWNHRELLALHDERKGR